MRGQRPTGHAFGRGRSRSEWRPQRGIQSIPQASADRSAPLAGANHVRPGRTKSKSQLWLYYEEPSRREFLNLRRNCRPESPSKLQVTYVTDPVEAEG